MLKWSHKDIADRVLSLAEGIGSDQPKIDSSLIHDLDFDSLELIDLIANLEGIFGVSISTHELYPSFIVDGRPSGISIQSKPETERGKRLCESDLNVLRKSYPHINFDGLGDKPSYDQVLRRLNIGSVVNYIQIKLGVEENGRIEN